MSIFFKKDEALRWGFSLAGFACFAAALVPAGLSVPHLVMFFLLGAILSACGYSDAKTGETPPFAFAAMFLVSLILTGFQVIFYPPTLPFYFAGIIVNESLPAAIALELLFPCFLGLFLLTSLFAVHCLENRAGRPLMGGGDLKCFVAVFFLPLPANTLLMAFCGGLLLTVATAYCIHRSFSASIRVLPYFIPYFALCLALIQFFA